MGLYILLWQQDMRQRRLQTRRMPDGTDPGFSFPSRAGFVFKARPVPRTLVTQLP